MLFDKQTEEEMYVARRGGLEKFVMSMAREVARQHKAAEAAKRRAASAASAEERRFVREAKAVAAQERRLVREAEISRRDEARFQREAERDQKRRHLQKMESKAVALTEQISEISRS